MVKGVVTMPDGLLGLWGFSEVDECLRVSLGL